MRENALCVSHITVRSDCGPSISFFCSCHYPEMSNCTRPMDDSGHPMTGCYSTLFHAPQEQAQKETIEEELEIVPLWARLEECVVRLRRAHIWK